MAPGIFIALGGLGRSGADVFWAGVGGGAMLPGPGRASKTEVSNPLTRLFGSNEAVLADRSGSLGVIPSFAAVAALTRAAASAFPADPMAGPAVSWRPDEWRLTCPLARVVRDRGWPAAEFDRVSGLELGPAWGGDLAAVRRVAAEAGATSNVQELSLSARSAVVMLAGELTSLVQAKGWCIVGLAALATSGALTPREVGGGVSRRGVAMRTALLARLADESGGRVWRPEMTRWRPAPLMVAHERQSRGSGRGGQGGAGLRRSRAEVDCEGESRVAVGGKVG